MTEIKSFDLLDPVEKKIYTACKSARFKQLSVNRIGTICTDIVSGAVAFKGQNMAAQDKISLGSTLAYDLKNRYGILNEVDVRTAIDEGLHKKYGEYFGLNMATFADWLDKIEAVKRSMLNRMYMEDADNKRKENEGRMLVAHKKTPKEQSKEYYDVLIQMIEKDNKMPAGYAYNECWKYMEDEGIIKMDQKEKDKFIEEVRAVIKSEADEKRLTERMFNYTDYVERLSQPNSLAEKCKFEAVKRYFKTKLELNETNKV